MARLVQRPELHPRARQGAARLARGGGTESMNMKRILAITIALVFGVGSSAPSFAALAQQNTAQQNAAKSAAFDWNGKWQGTTAAGRALVLDLRVAGDRMTGKLTVGKQSADIVAGKIIGEVFALSTGKIDGQAVDATGKHVGDGIELTIEGVKAPLTLTRAS